MIRLLCIISVCILWPMHALAAQEILYVRPPAACANNGDGTAYGCAASPGAPGAFRTSDNILFDTTDETAGKVDPGDLLYVCGQFIAATNGVFFYGGTLDNENGSGTSTNRITISFNCPGDPGSIVGSGGQNFAWASYRSYYDLVLGAAALTGGDINTLAILPFSGATKNLHVTVTGGTIRDHLVVGEKCISIVGQHVTLNGVTVTNCATDGIGVNGKYTEIKNSTISRVSQLNSNGDCIQFSGNVDGAYIHNNICDHSDKDTKYCYLSSASSDNGFVRIEHNTCIRPANSTTGLGILIEGSPGVILGNTITNGYHGAICNPGAARQCDVIGNLIITPTSRGVSVGDAASTLSTVAHNTIIGGATGIHFDANAARLVTKNNILSGQATGINKSVAGGAPVDAYNLFYNISGNNLVVNGTPTAPGPNSFLATNPLFINAADYRLQGVSPARRTGISGQLCIDVRGRACYPDTPDIGAYQATSGDPAGPRAPVQ